MLATPTDDYLSYRRTPRDPNLSPPRRPLRATPLTQPFFDGPLLTPSPRRSRGVFDAVPADLQSPFRTPAPAPPTLSWKRPDASDDADEPLLTPSRHKQPRPVISAASAHPSRTGAGTKRKTTPHATPLRQHSLTPLVVTPSHPGLDRLAPLPPPKFGQRTPKTRTETDASLHSQTNSLTHLDLNKSAHDLDFDDDDEMPKPTTAALFPESAVKVRRTPNRLFKDVQAAEVAEAISPGGHVTKRRARSRPLSDELLQTIQTSPSPTDRSRNVVTFPGKKTHHRRKSSGSSSSSNAAPSPAPRSRVSGLNGAVPSRPSTMQHRAPMARVDSATLFFGGPSVQPPAVRSRTNTSLSNSFASYNDPMSPSPRPKVTNRHSFAGLGGAVDFWGTIQSRSMLPSPQSSPMSTSLQSTVHEDTDDDDDVFNAGRDSSFLLTVDTPSPRTEKHPITSKFRQARDSGIVLSDDDTSMDSSASGDQLMPAASTSVSTIQSELDDEGLVTPGFAPTASSGWPQVYRPEDDGDGLDMDAFILQTLMASSKAPPEVKKAPNTPVKKNKTSYLSGAARPWQSAVASRVARGIDWDVKPTKAPRKSMPIGFPADRKHGKSAFDPATDSEDEQDSPSTRKAKYNGVGIGRPPLPTPRDVMPAIPRPRWLTRRSSSGAFSSGSDSLSLIGTPTKNQNRGAALRGSRVSPSKHMSRFSPARSASGSSTSSILSSPTTSRKLSPVKPRPAGRKSFVPRPSLPLAQDQVGRFDRDFVVLDDELGSGEFGKVIKARAKAGEEMYAIKKSKPFEGVKHRHRLREEADILRHLGRMNGGQRHENVLAFVDSWEEDEVLYIQTELCAAGSLSHFLWIFGQRYPRLEESRVWKIIADLSNGLMFIHDSGVIHLDVKPANIFVTLDGRFKIGDFGMASLWPRPVQSVASPVPVSAFEREGDKVYLAPEVLQGKYSKAADVFSLGMTILETATNIIVPDQGEAWHRLRREDFSQVELYDSPELLDLLQQMMRTAPVARIDMRGVYSHPVVSRARVGMEEIRHKARRDGVSLFVGSPLAGGDVDFLETILGRGAMDLSP